MHAEFSALRTDVRAEIRAGDDETRRYAERLHDEVITRLREEIRGGDEETRRQMRVLHEEVISRIALLQEGLPLRRRRRG